MVRLAEGCDAGVGHVVALNGNTIHDPTLVTTLVGEVADEPVPSQRDTDTHGGAPNHPGPPPEGKEQDRPGQLLCHPRRLDEAVERIIGDAILDHEAWR